MHLKSLETERLILKMLTPEVFTELFANYSEEYIADLLGLKNHEEFLIEKNKSDGGYKTYDRTILGFAMVEKASGRTIGRCGFHNWYPMHQKAEVGYVIFDESDRKKGYMNEAVTAFIEYGFKSMDLNRIEANISPNNEPSLNLIKRQGFTQEGHLRQHYLKDGVLDDSLIFSLLKSEYDENIKSKKS